MSQSDVNALEPMRDEIERFSRYMLVEFPLGDFKNYYYQRQIWMVVIHVNICLLSSYSRT
jgi:hypothetical protein